MGDGLPQPRVLVGKGSCDLVLDFWYAELVSLMCGWPGSVLECPAGVSADSVPHMWSSLS